MGFAIKQIGNFEHLNAFLGKMLHDDIYADLDAYGQQGVSALSNATPVDSGVTADSWYYIINQGFEKTTITWLNSHKDDDGAVPVVILLEYGHGTGTGGYVQGYDFINPAIKPIMDQIANDVWAKVVKA